jgi:hypothetical protein
MLRKEHQLKIRREAEEREDNHTCLAYGAKLGSDVYVNCRIRLVSIRSEQADRERQHLANLERLNSIGKQIELRDEQRSLAIERIENERRREEQLREQKTAEDRAKRDKSERLEAAQRMFEAAARMSQPSQPAAAPSLMPMLPRRTQCFVNGAYVDCRSQ